jgi:hypothetical protein
MPCPLLPLFDYRAKQNSNCIINMRCVYIFGFLSRMPFWRRSDWYMHFNYPQRIFHFPFLSFSLITLNVSWILRPVSSSVSRQNGIHSRWPIGQLRNQKMKFSKGKKEGGGGWGAFWFMFSMIFLPPLLHQHLSFHCLIWRYLPQESFLLLQGKYRK